MTRVRTVKIIKKSLFFLLFINNNFTMDDINEYTNEYSVEKIKNEKNLPCNQKSYLFKNICTQELIENLNHIIINLEAIKDCFIFNNEKTIQYSENLFSKKNQEIENIVKLYKKKIEEIESSYAHEVNNINLEGIFLAKKIHDILTNINNNNVHFNNVEFNNINKYIEEYKKIKLKKLLGPIISTTILDSNAINEINKKIKRNKHVPLKPFKELLGEYNYNKVIHENIYKALIKNFELENENHQRIYSFVRGCYTVLLGQIEEEIITKNSISSGGQSTLPIRDIISFTFFKKIKKYANKIPLNNYKKYESEKNLLYIYQIIEYCFLKSLKNHKEDIENDSDNTLKIDFPYDRPNYPKIIIDIKLEKYKNYMEQLIKEKEEEQKAQDNQ